MGKRQSIDSDGPRLERVLQPSWRYAPEYASARQDKSAKERAAVTDWAQFRKEQGCPVDVESVRSCASEPPDCLVEIGGDTVGVEVTELVCQGAVAYNARQISNSELGKRPAEKAWWREKAAPKRVFEALLDPDLIGFVIWTQQDLLDGLQQRIKAKDKRWHRSDIRKQLLLIVTGEDYMDGETLSNYLQTIRVERPKYLTEVYLMSGYEPNPAGRGDGCRPVFALKFRN